MRLAEPSHTPTPYQVFRVEVAFGPTESAERMAEGYRTAGVNTIDSSKNNVSFARRFPGNEWSTLERTKCELLCCSVMAMSRFSTVYALKLAPYFSAFPSPVARPVVRNRPRVLLGRSDSGCLNHPLDSPTHFVANCCRIHEKIPHRAGRRRMVFADDATRKPESIRRAGMGIILGGWTVNGFINRCLK